MENKTKKKGLLERITSSRVFRVMFSRKIIVVCAILLLIMVLIAIFAPVIAPYDPNKDDLYNVLKGCSAEHWLGTDSNGRDVLSRIIYGARISFTVGIVAVVISSVIGMALGLIAGMAGGVVDAFIMRVMDAMMAVPMLILAMFLGAILGQGLGNVCLAIGISMVPGYARVTRGQVLSVRNCRLCHRRYPVRCIPDPQHAGACVPQLPVRQHRQHDRQPGRCHSGRSEPELPGHGHHAPDSQLGRNGQRRL